jgi:hypothetical protein
MTSKDIIQPEKKYERLASPEEMVNHKRLIDGCDQYHFGFGIDDEPQIEAESPTPKPVPGRSAR